MELDTSYEDDTKMYFNVPREIPTSRDCLYIDPDMNNTDFTDFETKVYIFSMLKHLVENHSPSQSKIEID